MRCLVRLCRAALCSPARAVDLRPSCFAVHTLVESHRRLHARPCTDEDDEGDRLMDGWRMDGHGGELAGVEVEILSADADPSPATSEGACGAVSSSSATEETVSVLDLYARAALANYMVRASSEPRGAASGAYDVVMREVGGVGGRVRYHARQRLPLPAAYGERVAEGFGATVKEADTLAAMHALRILDALGLPVFQLSSKQRRHALAAREAGRSAPLPGDAVAPPSTPSPPPLRYEAEGRVATMERRLRVDPSAFVAVSRGAFTPFRDTLASAYFLDLGSVRRLRQFFRCHGTVLERHVRVAALHRGAGEPAVYVAQLRLPLPQRFGNRTCMGRAPTHREAVALACMHAELTIDALGLPLYPQDAARQRAHAAECAMVGRACAAAEAGEQAACPNAPTPQPLQLVEETAGGLPGRPGGAGTTTHTAELVGGGEASVEAILVQHARAIASVDRVVEIEYLAEGTGPLLRLYLAHCAAATTATSATAPRARSPCFVEVLGVKYHETYRATVTVPLPSLHEGQPESSEGREEFVAIGIAAESAAQAELAAAHHAIRALAAMNRPIAFTAEARGLLHGFALSTAAGVGFPTHNPTLPARRPGDLASATGAVAALMLPVRSVGPTHLGRVLGTGLVGNREASPRPNRAVLVGAAAAAGHQPPPTPTPVRLREEQRMADILENRQRLPVADWSLAADAGERILVDPAAVASAGRNYVHTLSAVRTPDVFAVNRLRDYLERHGKQLDTSLAHHVADPNAGEEGCSGAGRDETLRLHTVTCVLPTRLRVEAATAVPAPLGSSPTLTAAARVVAQGEAYSAEDALLACAMHAELLLDALGIPLYDHPELQRRHADTARMLGRWAPMSAGALPPASLAAVPPPVRKTHAQCPLWARVLQQRWRGESAGGPPVVGGASVSPAAEADAAPTDDELCDLARLQPIHSSEIFRMAAKHVQAYYRGRGSDFYRSVRQYTTPTSEHGNLHRAIAELPVPPAYGRRFAVGCADTKKRALALCATHAAWTLDALGLPIYTGARQEAYAQAARLRGRTAPRPGEARRAPDTPSPPGLCCLPGCAGMLAAHVPHPPTPEELKRDGRVWSVYVRACRTFIDKAREAHLHESLVVLQQSPRSDIAVEDDALEVVERASADPRARHRLAAVCARVRLPPPTLPFRYEVYGRSQERRFVAEAPVLGTPYTARGLGRTAAEALARVAMHYEQVVLGVSDGVGGPVPVAAATNGALPRAEAAHPPVARRAGGPTVAVQEMAIALYAVTRPPYQPMRVVTAGVDDAVVATATLADGRGLQLQGRSAPRASTRVAVGEAVEKLFVLLEPRAPLQVVVRLLRRWPQLRPGAVVAASALDDALRTAPASPARREVVGEAEVVVQALTRGPAGPVHDTSPLAETLRELVAGLSSSSLLSSSSSSAGTDTAPPPLPLPLPATARDLLPQMGLVRALAGGGVWQPTLLGVATAQLLTCLPPPPPADTTTPTTTTTTTMSIAGRRFVTGPALPLQLAKLLVLGGLLCGGGPPESAAAAAATVCRVASLVACGPHWMGAGACGVDRLASEDVVAVARRTMAGEWELPAEVHAHERELYRRVRALAAAGGPSRLAAVLQPYTAGAALTEGVRPVNAPAAATTEALVRMCVAAATFSEVWTPRCRAPLGVAGPLAGLALVESRDGLRTALVHSPPLPDLPALSSCPPPPLVCYAAFDCAVVSDSRPSLGPSRAASETAAPALVRRTARALRQHYGHVWICGAAVSPLAYLAATQAGGNEAAVLTVDSDADRVLLLCEGAVAVGVRTTATARSLQELQRVFAMDMEAFEPCGSGGSVAAVLAVSATPLEAAVHGHGSCADSATIAAYVSEHDE